MGMIRQLPPELSVFSPELTAHLDRKLALFEAELAGNMQSDIEIVSRMTQYIQKGGKRLRPLVLMLSSHIAGYEGSQDVLFAVIMEFVHTATLIHDDIIDGATQRRGRQSLNHAWGNSLTVLMGDYLYIKAMSLALTKENMRILRLISDITLRMVEGEMIGLHRSGDIAITEEEYLDLIRRKTAYLFSGCAQIGGILGGVSAQKEAALQSFGLNLGMAFQLIDDLLDFTAKESVLGKPVGNDLKEGKITLPLISLLQRGAGDPAVEKIRALLLEHRYDQIPREGLSDLLERSEAFSEAEGKAKHYAAMAKNDLALFSESDARSAMLELLDFVIHRSW